MKARRLVIDRQHLLQMLGDKDFYASCPVFLWLQESALSQIDLYHRSAGCCGGDWRVVAQVAEAFFQNLRKLYALDPQHVECVREYLAKKKHYQPRPVVLFYRPADRSKPHRFEF